MGLLFWKANNKGGKKHAQMDPHKRRGLAPRYFGRPPFADQSQLQHTNENH